MSHEEMFFFFKWPKNALKPSGWGNIYGRQFYTTQLRLSNFRCLELLSDPQRIQHNEAGLYMKFYALRKYDQRRKLTKTVIIHRVVESNIHVVLESNINRVVK